METTALHAPSCLLAVLSFFRVHGSKGHETRGYTEKCGYKRFKLTDIAKSLSDNSSVSVSVLRTHTHTRTRTSGKFDFLFGVTCFVVTGDVSEDGRILAKLEVWV